MSNFFAKLKLKLKMMEKWWIWWNCGENGREEGGMLKIFCFAISSGGLTGFRFWWNVSLFSGLSGGEKVTLKNGRPTAHLLSALQKKPEHIVLEQIIDRPCLSTDNFLHKICTNIWQDQTYHYQIYDNHQHTCWIYLWAFSSCVCVCL